MRRPLLIVTAAACAVLAAVLPAAAAGLTWVSPGAGAVVSGPVDVAVQVQRSVGETVDGVTVRLSLDGTTTAPGTTTRELRCAESDGCNSVGQGEDRWGLVELAPDGGALATGPVCNGQYVLQARPAGADGWAGIPVVLSDRTVAPVAGLTADGEPRAAHLSWAPPADAGDVRLVVERRPEGASSWDSIATLAGSATTYTDSGVTAGTWDYRVVSQRGDGFRGGRPVAACTDTEADHTAASTPSRAVVAPGPEPTPSPTSTGGTGDGTDDGTAPGPSEQDGPTPAGDEPTGAEDAPGDAEGDDAGTTDGGSSGRTRVAAPPPARRSTSQVQAPAIARARDEGPSYYGEGDAYSDELDYGDAAPMVAESATEADQTSALGRLVPGGTETITRLRLDERQVLLPIAAGLLLLASGMHVRRWMRSA